MQDSNASCAKGSARCGWPIGVSFELPALYTRLTALENLKLLAALYDGPTREPREVLRWVELEDAANQRIETFSKGMKMRLNLCRALIHDPELLFLDEPTSGQDPSRAKLTRALIQRLKAEGRTIFLTTHNMAEADEICDQVAFLVDGSIPVSGPPDELKRTYGRRVVDVTMKQDGHSSRHEFPMQGIENNQDMSKEEMESLGSTTIVSRVKCSA